MNHNVYKYGDVVYANLPESSGSIQSGRRPVVVIQNDTGNKHSPTVQVVPLTTKFSKAKLPTHVYLDAKECGLPQNSLALCEGVLLIEKSIIDGYICSLPAKYMGRIGIACIINTPHFIHLAFDNVVNLWERQNHNAQIERANKARKKLGKYASSA